MRKLPKFLKILKIIQFYSMLFNCVLSQVDAQARAQQAQRIEAETRADQAQAAAASKALEEGRVLPQPTEEPRKIQS